MDISCDENCNKIEIDHEWEILKSLSPEYREFREKKTAEKKEQQMQRYSDESKEALMKIDKEFMAKNADEDGHDRHDHDHNLDAKFNEIDAKSKGIETGPKVPPQLPGTKRARSGLTTGGKTVDF